MSFEIGWNRRDETTGKRIRIEFKLVRRDVTWKVQRDRYETRETFEPDESDWDELFERLDKHLKRGKVQLPDIKLIHQLRRDGKA